jgi:phosphonate transport system substrate-binding protein
VAEFFSVADRTRRALAASLAGALVLLPAGCGREEPEQPLRYATAPAHQTLPTYLFAVHPLHNPQKLAATYQPLVDLLNRRLKGARVELLAARDYSTYNARLRARGPALLLPNPWQTLEAIKVGYRVIAMAGDAKDFRGLLLARRDTPIREVADLKGKVVSYPAQTALAACIMPQFFLHQRGLDVNRDITNAYVGSQESSILQAYLGKAAVAATWPPPWRMFQQEHPREAAELKVLWETPALVNNSVMLRDDVPPDVAESIRSTLLTLGASAEGRLVLAGMSTSSFTAADNATYAPVRAYIADFEREVRSVEGP